MIESITIKNGSTKLNVPLHRVHTLVLGSGAAGLNAAVQLDRLGVKDVLILTEGLRMGTSINTGSDKQTYYKLSLCGDQNDSPRCMAETYLAAGSMHGDLALVEAAVSARAFLNLVQLGVPFPQDPFGQFVGYKTDHDPRQRATSVGPYTSREMCRALIREVKARKIRVAEKRNAVQLLTVGKGRGKRAAGVIAVDAKGQFEVYLAENTVFATGGPGGLYRTSVYPEVHTGAIGLALMEGAKAQNLPECQFGLASIGFRWNVSGTYMQVIPRFVSTDQNGGDAREFLPASFKSVGEMNSMVFLKGYQWPFDPRKASNGSSVVDLLVHEETVGRGRRVWLDFRSNPDGFRFEDLSDEAREYLEKSRALQKTPIERLRAMNPGAIELYRDHGIDIEKEMLEIAVCAQHNNGGLAANHWWESDNIKHLFPVGEVNGSHGVARPGGSALNSGQVGAIRAADYIANAYGRWTLKDDEALNVAQTAVADLQTWLERCPDAPRDWEAERLDFQQRMTESAAHVRSTPSLERAVDEAKRQWKRLQEKGCSFQNRTGLVEALRNRQLCYAHLVYLDAIRHAVESGVGSRGSSLVLSPSGKGTIPAMGDAWRYIPENAGFREQVLETVPSAKPKHTWVPRRPLPESDTWFETAWAAYRDGKIYRT